jgi:hypothetical protein
MGNSLALPAPKTDEEYKALAEKTGTRLDYLVNKDVLEMLWTGHRTVQSKMKKGANYSLLHASMKEGIERRSREPIGDRDTPMESLFVFSSTGPFSVEWAKNQQAWWSILNESFINAVVSTERALENFRTYETFLDLMDKPIPDNLTLEAIKGFGMPFLKEYLRDFQAQSYSEVGRILRGEMRPSENKEAFRSICVIRALLDNLDQRDLFPPCLLLHGMRIDIKKSAGDEFEIKGFASKTVSLETAVHFAQYLLLNNPDGIKDRCMLVVHYDKPTRQIAPLHLAAPYSAAWSELELLTYPGEKFVVLEKSVMKIRIQSKWADPDKKWEKTYHPGLYDLAVYFVRAIL